MIGPLNGPWLLVAALLLLAVAARRGPRPRRGEVWLVFAVAAGGAAARSVWGIWGPLHINGQGPLWIRGALDPDALASYGPGYFELFGWVVRLGASATSVPDRAIFAANALLSSLHAPLFYTVARLVGVGRGGALAGALLLAADPVTIRTAASEGYFSSLVALVLAVQLSLALWVHADKRRDALATVALGAACLFAAAAARIHPMAYLPLALSPLVVFGAAPIADWRSRLALSAAAAAAIAAGVLVTSGATVLTALGSSPMTGQAIGGLALGDYGPLLALAALVLVLHRWTNPRWLPLLAIFSLALLLATRGSFQQHPLWQLCYQRLFFAGILLGCAGLLPRRVQGAGWGLVAAAVVAVPLSAPALRYFGERNTEQLEYGFLQEVLGAAPRDCTVASVTRVGNRIWEIPSYLVPSSAGGAATQRAVQTPSDLDTGAVGGCLLYVRSSLCSSVEARELCESVERAVPLERVASRVFPAAPSYTGLPYDRSEVEVVLFRTAAAPSPRVARPEAGGEGGAATVSDGAPITPEFAQALYAELTQLRAPDGCRLVAFDTARFRIRVGLEAPSGAAHAFELATARRGQGGRRAGDWALAVPEELERDCAATLAALERALSGTGAPRRTLDWGPALAKNALIVSTFVALIVGTLAVLWREVRAKRPSPYAVLALALVWLVALGLRLTISPRTFLHEYYHVAETVAGYLAGEGPPLYGDTGPSLFRAVATVLDRPHDVEVIFLTNAVISSLAIAAVALLDLALLRSWPRAIAAAVFLCVLPQHLRFSAAEDLFVQAVTFGLWALALAALYARSRRLVDALASVLALSLAMQSRPEMLFLPAVAAGMVLLVDPRGWRLLFARRTLLALAVLALLLVPRFVELQQVLAEGSPSPGPPPVLRYFGSLVLLDGRVTPPAYWLLLALGAVWTWRRKPGLLAWVALVYGGYTLFSQSMFDNAPYRLRSQLLPNSFLVLLAAGAASAWIERFGQSRRALAAGACVLVAVGAGLLVPARGFVTELRDQQLEFAFLERTVPRLPERATLLTAAEVGQRKFDAFPAFLLSHNGKGYEVVDVRRAASGDVAWPAPAENLLYYQGMFCYFAAEPGEPAPDPMTLPCLAVHERYAAEPLFVESLETEGYSEMPYAEGPYRIGFFRLRAAR